jgi:hypothetical protein
MVEEIPIFEWFFWFEFFSLQQYISDNFKVKCAKENIQPRRESQQYPW